MEADASSQAISAGGMLATGRLEFPRAYNNGFGYAAQLAFTSLVSGIGLNPVQLASGIWVFVVVLVAFVTYRELLGGAFGGALAAFLLLIQPDFLFYVVRGSHERSTWTCALLMLFFLVRSYRYAASPGKLAPTCCSFTWPSGAWQPGMFFLPPPSCLPSPSAWRSAGATSACSCGTSPAEGTAGDWWRRLLLVALTCLVIVFLFINYAYRSVAANLFLLQKSGRQDLACCSWGRKPIAEPGSLQYFGDAWRSQPAYLVLTGVQWAISFSSLACWLWLMFRLSRLEPKQRLLWQLYTSFGALVAFGLVADIARYMSSNMQLRMFTPFALFTSALAALGALQLWPRLASGLRNAGWSPAAGLLAVFAFVAVQVKITNDPTLGNQWFFYSPAEVRAMEWTESKRGQPAGLARSLGKPAGFLFLPKRLYRAAAF